MDFTGGAVFILVAVPAIFFLLVWVAVTVARLLYPEKPLPLDPDPAGRSKLKKSLGGTQVSAREIRTRQQHLVGFGEGETGSGSESIPTSWKDDLWARRN